MRKVLMIVNLHDASPRIPGMAKYLQEFGWQSVLVTPPAPENHDSLPGTRIVETKGYARSDVRSYARDHFESRKSYRRVKPILRFLYRRYSEIRHYPDREKGWIPFALGIGDDLLQKENIDAVLTSSPPVTTNIVAAKLKKKHNIPWLADFRDLWTQNHNYPYSALRKLFERRLEIKTLSTADALVATSMPMASKLNRLHRMKKTYTITNGFDPEKMSEGKVNLTSKFTITYTGQIYRKQIPQKLLVALRDLINEGSIRNTDIEVRVFGPPNELLEGLARTYGLTEIVNQHGVVPREVSLQKQRESQVLWQITWEDPREKGAYSGKIFEYLGAHRPILATGGFGGDVVEEIIEETNSGYYCPTIEDVKSALTNLYSEYRSKGAVSYRGNISEINKYSYHETARLLAEALEECVNVQGQTNPSG